MNSRRRSSRPLPIAIGYERSFKLTVMQRMQQFKSRASPDRLLASVGYRLQLRVLQKSADQTAWIGGGRLKYKMCRPFIQLFALGKELIDAHPRVCCLQQWPRSIMARAPVD